MWLEWSQIQTGFPRHFFFVAPQLTQFSYYFFNQGRPNSRWLPLQLMLQEATIWNSFWPVHQIGSNAFSVEIHSASSKLKENYDRDKMLNHVFFFLNFLGEAWLPLASMNTRHCDLVVCNTVGCLPKEVGGTLIGCHQNGWSRMSGMVSDTSNKWFTCVWCHSIYTLRHYELSSPQKPPVVSTISTQDPQQRKTTNWT